MKRLVILFVLMIFLISAIYASCNDTQININTAGAEDLDKIDHVGEAVAGYIIDYRTNVKKFDSLDELVNVKYISLDYVQDIKQQGLACVDEEVENQEKEEDSSNQTSQDEEQEEENTIEEEEEDEEDNQEEDEENLPERVYESISPKNLTLETIELNSGSKDIKSMDNKEILKRNLVFAGIVTFCVTFGGALFLLNTRRRKSEFR